MNRTDTARRKPVLLPPEPHRTRTDIVACCYLLIFVTGGGMLFLNIYGDHQSGLKIGLAVVIGGFPPFISTLVAHISATADSARRKLAYGIIVAAMGVSAANVTLTLCPPLEWYLVAPLAVAADAASIYCLTILIGAEVKRIAHRRWQADADAARADEAARGSGGRSDDALQNHGPAGSGTGGQNQSGSGGSGSGTGGPEVPAGSGTGGSGGPGPAGSGDRDARDPAAERALVAAEIAAKNEARDRFAADWAITHPRPGGPESDIHQARRALIFLEAYRVEFGGERVNGTRFAKAMAMSKSDAGKLRNSLDDAEDKVA